MPSSRAGRSACGPSQRPVRSRASRPTRGSRAFRTDGAGRGLTNRVRTGPVAGLPPAQPSHIGNFSSFIRIFSNTVAIMEIVRSYV